MESLRPLAKGISVPGHEPMRRDIRCSRLLIYSARIAIENSQSLGASDQLWNAEQLNRAAHSLMEAADLIHRATYSMQEANAAIASAPESYCLAFERLAADAKRMMDAAGDLNMVAIQLNVAVANAVLLERSGHIADARCAITVPPPGIRLLQDDSPHLPLRRRRSLLATIEDAIRRVCRGRAPPVVSLCPL
ncbi:MAG TPA: hypothetical protein VNN08_17430 [Thermoanaerobaculia bacterium]|nr:hypothetical protein [Thermoanaerobaculia bacterium]